MLDSEIESPFRQEYLIGGRKIWLTVIHDAAKMLEHMALRLGHPAVFCVHRSPAEVLAPGDIIVEATSASGAVVTFDVTATDNIGVESGPTCTPSSGSEFSLGQTIVICEATDGIGNVGSASFSVTVLTPRALEEAALGDLQNLQNSLNDEGQEKMAEVLEYLNESIFGEPGDDEQIWLDGFHLDQDNGDDFFGTQNDAVEKLMEIIEKADEYGASSSVVDNIIDIIENKILKADRILAQIAIGEAAGGDPDLIEEANEEMSKAVDEIANGQYDKAIENYSKAWESAIDAVEEEDDDDE